MAHTVPGAWGLLWVASSLLPKSFQCWPDSWYAQTHYLALPHRAPSDRLIPSPNYNSDCMAESQPTPSTAPSHISLTPSWVCTHSPLPSSSCCSHSMFSLLFCGPLLSLPFWTLLVSLAPLSMSHCLCDALSLFLLSVFTQFLLLFIHGHLAPCLILYDSVWHQIFLL